ncbi:MAG: universal stress protein [Hyphomonadaceae bacterium]
MIVRDILAIVLEPQEDDAVIRAAELLAGQSQTALAAALLTALPEEPVAYEPSVVAGVWAELLNRARQEAAGVREKLEARLAQTGKKWEVRAAEALARDLGRVAAVHARYSDMAIVRRPGENENLDLHHDLVEGVLFHSGRPALVIPPGWAGKAIGKRPILAWDASREATRALSEADWLIESAEQVTIVTVDAKPKAFGHGPQPGENIARHLQRRGLKAQVVNLEAVGRPADALLAQAVTQDADLIIMGGYAHARIRELVFGGATRDMLETANVPLLMAH